MDTTTALAFVLPEQFRENVNNIRQKYDKAYDRWPPHINFLFPFVSVTEFEQIREKLSSLELFGSIEANFNTLGYFSQSKENITFHLKLDKNGEEKFQKLFEEIKKLLPHIPIKRPDFHPHLTLGQCKNTEWCMIEEEIINQLNGLDNFMVNVDCLVCLHRNQSTNDKMVEFVKINLDN